MTNPENNPEEYKCKVILLGESGIGKSCLIKRFCQNEFDQNTQVTLGSSFNSKTIYFKTNESLQMNVWDTAGQESYRSLNKIFYRDAKIVLLVYDITNMSSYNELRNYWYRQVETGCKSCASKLKIIIIFYSNWDRRK